MNHPEPVRKPAAERGEKEVERIFTAEAAEHAEERKEGNLTQRHKGTKGDEKTSGSPSESELITHHSSPITSPPSPPLRTQNTEHRTQKEQKSTKPDSFSNAHSQRHTQNPRAVILCGELSGEVYAAGLTRELVEAGVDVYGMGGDRCRAAGMEIIRDYSDLSVVGITEVIEKLGSLKAAMKQLVSRIRELQPDVLVCIDFPDFNIRIARKVRKYVGKLVYFVPPQVWAWRRYRARMLSQLFDRIFVLFPFEVPLFDNGEFHGHPLAEQVKPEIPEYDFLSRYGLPETGKRVLFLPGSRKREYRTLSPVLAEAARRFQDKWANVSLMVLPSPSMPLEEKDKLLSQLSSVTVIEPEHKYTGMAVADLAVGASGTVTLECGLSGTPMAVLYRLNPVTTAVGMLAVVSRFISIPNVVLGEAVMAELVNRDCNADEILRYAESMLESSEHAAVIKRRLGELKKRLYREGSFHRVAARIMELI
ncbi:MAG: lipid-A-disaccharide synthase [Acidobacteria bacterium]|nr:lipid-A-disaccharide synthase [Acidobacteriota bacterium]